MRVPHQQILAFQPQPRQHVSAARRCSALCKQLQLQWAALRPAPTAVCVPAGMPRTSPQARQGLQSSPPAECGTDVCASSPEHRQRRLAPSVQLPAPALQPSGCDFCEQISQPSICPLTCHPPDQPWRRRQPPRTHFRGVIRDQGMCWVCKGLQAPCWQVPLRGCDPAVAYRTQACGPRESWLAPRSKLSVREPHTPVQFGGSILQRLQGAVNPSASAEVVPALFLQPSCGSEHYSG